MRADSINNTLLGTVNQRKDLWFAGIVRRLPRWITPNGITITRIFLVIPLYWLYTNGHSISALIVFCIALATDLFDGILARLRGNETTVGKLFDPAADKVLIITVFFMVAMNRISHTLIYTLIGLEIALVVLAIIIGPLVQRFLRRQPKLGANNAGKIKMALESVAVALLLVSPAPMITTIASYCLWVAVLFAALSIFLHLILREPTARSY